MQTPGEQLIELLEQMRNRLNSSGTERTLGLKRAMGDDCVYYKKSMAKFIKDDYVDLKNITDQIQAVFNTIEGK